MKVVFLVTDAYGGHGGIALFNREFTAALATRPDIETITVIPRVAGDFREPLPPHVAFVSAAARSPLAYIGAIEAARRQTPELVVCGHVNLLPAAAAIARPLLVTHGIEAWRRPKSVLTRTLMRRVRAVVSVSELTRSRFVAAWQFRGPSFVLPNAIRDERYGLRPRRDELIQRYGIRTRRLLLTVGRVDARERYKGFDEILDALHDLPDDVGYLIAGGGSDLPRLRARVEAERLAGRVFFTGSFDERDKADLYALADAYVMPSSGEGFGFVFLEAMASGLPVIASKHDGGREALRDGALGRLVDPTNRGELRAAIVEALETPRSIPEGLRFFGFEEFGRRIATILDTLAVDHSVG